MLKPVTGRRFRVRNARFAIVASKYNARYVDTMLAAARAELKRAGVKELQIVRVPGAFEIPVVAARLAHSAFHASPVLRTSTAEGGRSTLHGIICLGVILRGETVHAAHIGEAVSAALMEIQLRYGVPVIHEVLLLESQEQARVRCLGTKHNRGAEAAQTALAMAAIMKNLNATVPIESNSSRARNAPR
jgi:6,7-dimethyl-8-ribityllumazine synthase